MNEEINASGFAQRLREQTARLKSEGFKNGIEWIAVRRGADIVLLGGDGVELCPADKVKTAAPAAFALLSDVSELNAVLFTSPEYCAGVAAILKSIPPVLDDMAQIVGPKALVIDGADTDKLVRAMKKRFACIVRGTSSLPSGALTAGRSIEQAFTAALVLEKSARVFALAGKLGGAKPLGALDAALMHLVYTKKYSKISAAAPHRTAADMRRPVSELELSLREAIVSCCTALSRENLVQGTWGNMSVRLDEAYMLCTPSGMDYDSLTPYDIVRVDISSLEYEGDLKPTSEKGFHAGILAAHPDVNCVIHAHSPSASVFAAAHAPLEGGGFSARIAKYGLPGTKTLSKNVCAAIADNRACIMENHGLLVCGPSIPAALDLCRTVENAGLLFLKEK